MDYICTWFCADEKGEESIFPQTGQSSSSPKHQEIYWKCIILFYSTSVRFNNTQQHLLFTNVKQLPSIGDRSVRSMLEKLGVKVISTDFKYKTPKGYFDMFQNQFYEFSILEYISANSKNPDDKYLIMDSDCIFIKSAAALFDASLEAGFLSFEDDCTAELVIHGLSRRDMKKLYGELLNREISEIPGYHLGEFFLASVKNIQVIFSDFLELWPNMLKRHELGLSKFNEEAQTLSFLYYKNGFQASTSKKLMKRIWTNPVFYRDVEKSDLDLIVWHLPAEKMFGLADLYQEIVCSSENFALSLGATDYITLVTKTLGIPDLSPSKKLKYYVLSYDRAIRKRLKKMKIANLL